MGGMLILQFLVLTFVVSGVIIFFLHRTLISSTQGAVNRLNTETEDARTKQAELNQKIKEADEELAKRKKEADALVKKMMEEAESKSKEERDGLIAKARKEAEDVILKAQRTKDSIRQIIEKESEIKLVERCAQILTIICSEKAGEAFSNQLVEDFLEQLKDVDAKQVSPEVETVDIVSLKEISSEEKISLEKTIKEKLNREVAFQYQVDPKIGGGIIVRFGSLTLNGSLQSAIDDAVVSIKGDIDKG